MSTKLMQAEALLSRAQTLLALASSYALASIHRNRLDHLGTPSAEYGDLDDAIRLYERSVGAWMSDLDRERGTSGPRGASAVHAVWAGRTEPLLALVRNGARTSRPNPARRKPARSKSGQRSGRRLP
jgi:hypothetical protein